MYYTGKAFLLLLTLAPWTRLFAYDSANFSQEQVSTGAICLPLPTFHTSPLQLCIDTVHNRVIDLLSFLAPSGVIVSALVFHDTLYPYPSLIPWALNSDNAVQPQSHRTPLALLCFSGKPQQSLYDQGMLSFFHEVCHAPSSLGKMWIWITSSSFKLTLFDIPFIYNSVFLTSFCMPSMQYVLFSLPRQLQLRCYNFSSCYLMDQSLYSSCHKCDRCTVPIPSAPAKITFPTLKFNHVVCSLCFPTALLLKFKLLVITSRAYHDLSSPYL